MEASPGPGTKNRLFTPPGRKPVTHPYGSLADLFYRPELQFGGRPCRIVYAVEHGRHTGASVDTRCNHQAHLIEQPGRKKCPVDVTATDNGQPLDPECLPKHLHRFRQIDTLLSDRNPRNSRSGQRMRYSAAHFSEVITNRGCPSNSPAGQHREPCVSTATRYPPARRATCTACRPIGAGSFATKGSAAA